MFVNCVLESIRINKVFSKNSGTHKTRCRPWGEQIPIEILEKPLHTVKELCFGFWSSGVIGLYFFQNDVHEGVTVNEARYKNELERILIQNK